jgi:hypothetical protein
VHVQYIFLRHHKPSKTQSLCLKDDIHFFHFCFATRFSLLHLPIMGYSKSDATHSPFLALRAPLYSQPWRQLQKLLKILQHSMPFSRHLRTGQHSMFSTRNFVHLAPKLSQLPCAFILLLCGCYTCKKNQNQMRNYARTIAFVVSLFQTVWTQCSWNLKFSFLFLSARAKRRFVLSHLEFSLLSPRWYLRRTLYSRRPSSLSRLAYPCALRSHSPLRDSPPTGRTSATCGSFCRKPCVLTRPLNL